MKGAPRSIGWGWMLVLLAAGCDGNFGNPTSLTDTTGEVFRWTCEDKWCSAEPERDFEIECGGESSAEFIVFVDGRRLASLCPLLYTAPERTYLELCRLIACEKTADCPQFEGYPYACENGLCRLVEDDGDVVSGMDVVALCLADTPHVRSCEEVSLDPIFEEAYLAGFHCHWNTCSSAPEWCRAP